ncbi:type III secretion system export apparatus subunit SctT [Paraburkholderia bannensis]|uniref:type III secretion system export apparatus subunit SctT n=1 Tax=Paraburkholderia bannensis TaxID=765414 RepID=UPI002AB5EC89|nr:type III secretion system export apparatus subunit SctT [Paraburkholderia bannensis]
MMDLSLSPLLGALGDLHSNVQGLLYMFALSSIRVMVVFLILPATSTQVLPGLVRAGVTYLLSGFIAASQTPDAFDHLSPVVLLMLTCKEAFIGLVIGYAASTIFWTAQAAGALIDNLAGFNNVQMSNPLQGEQNTPVSNVLMQLAITLFYISGGMTMLLGALFDSYRWWPLASTLPPGVVTAGNAAMDFLVNQGTTMLSTAIKLCAPVILVLILIDLGLGVISRAADKLEPTSLSQPLRGIVGVLLLIVLVSVLASQVRATLNLHGFAPEIYGAFTDKKSAEKPK